MAYDEVGGCRRCGFFHGECPIHETGRQSYANELTKKDYAFGVSMLFFVCVSTIFARPESLGDCGFYLWDGMKHPATCKDFACRFQGFHLAESEITDNKI